MTGSRHQKHVCRLVACVALLAVPLLTNVPCGPRAMALTVVSAPIRATTVTTASVTTTSTTTEPVTVALTSITPSIAVPKAPITISGIVRNAGSVPIASPVTRALIGERPLTSRDAVSSWANATQQRSLAEVAQTSLGATLAPGSVVNFTLTIAATAVSHREPFAVLPLRVDVVGTTPDAANQDTNLGSVQTFLPALDAVKKYEPLSIAWLVPLTLDPDPVLFGIDSAARVTAWTKAIGTGSRLDRLITGTDSTKVTWAIDPAILGPPQVPAPAATTTAPSPTPIPPPAPTQGETTTADPVTAMTTALAGRLRAAAPRHTLLSLPYADPDLDALLPLASGNSAVAPLITRASALDATVGSTRSDIAWPVAGTLTTGREQQLKTAFSSPGLSAAVVSASALSIDSGLTENASRMSSSGLPLLAYDDALSRTFAQTSSRVTGAITIQHFLADTMALLGERPGIPDRSVLVAAPRTFSGDPTVLRSFFAAVTQAPWLVPTATDQLLAASRAVTSEEVPAVGTTVVRKSPAGPLTAWDPLRQGTSLLTADSLRTITKTRSAITGIASIRDDIELFRVRWTDAQEQVLSSRWRGHGRGITAINTATSAAINAVSRGVRVVPSSVNFFADRGVLQITVVNDLPVPVHDVHLTLKPGQPRLRIDQQAGPLRIGANSRTNVKLQVTAIAAGLVPIQAVLTTANGTPLGQKARIDVRVQPTSTWIYWVLGGVAGVIFVLGTYRSLRRGPTRAARVAAQEVSLDALSP